MRADGEMPRRQADGRWAGRATSWLVQPTSSGSRESWGKENDLCDMWSVCPCLLSVATLTPPPGIFSESHCQHGPTGDPVQSSCCRPGIACRESDAECWVVCGMDFCGFRFVVLLCGTGLWASKQDRMHRGWQWTPYVRELRPWTHSWVLRQGRWPLLLLRTLR